MVHSARDGVKNNLYTKFKIHMLDCSNYVLDLK